MRKSSSIVLLLATSLVFAGCDSRSQPRIRMNPDGTQFRNDKGELVYEDDDGQHYTYSGSNYYPIYTVSNGYTHIPNTGIAAPHTSAAIKSSTFSSRGGFGTTGSKSFSGSFGS